MAAHARLKNEFTEDEKYNNLMSRLILYPSDCGPLTAPADGTVDYSASIYQSVATFTCNTGYTLQGSATLICQSNGNWDNADPTCQINGKVQLCIFNILGHYRKFHAFQF